MSDRPYELAWTPEGVVARVRLRGSSVLWSPMLNRGTAFTLAERESLGLTGLLPDGVSTIEGQLRRVYAQYLRQPDDLARNLHLGQVRNRNEVLFYRLLTEHIHEMLPIVYTPTVGTVIERYSLEFGRPARGVPIGGSSRSGRDGLPQLRAGARRGGPDRGHRLRGHPGYR